MMKFSDMQKWQVNRLISMWLLTVIIGCTFLAVTCTTLFKDKDNSQKGWKRALVATEGIEVEAAKRSINAVPVTVGTYLETFKQISIKDNSYRIVMLAWFKWNGHDDLDMINNFRIYKGTINKLDTVREQTLSDGTNYQLARVDVTITKSFSTKRFPLESHYLSVYLESQYPMKEVKFVGDFSNSTTNPSMSVSGYDVTRVENAVTAYQYDSAHSDPTLTEPIMCSEFVTAMELNRSSWGVYFKCIVALFGTTVWVLLVLYLNTYHRVDPLGMIPGALFGTVSNIMVAASLLPDALEMGLMEYINIWGILCILSVTATVISINRIRSKYENQEFAKFFGRIMFYTILVLTIAGNIALPVCAYWFK